MLCFAAVPTANQVLCVRCCCCCCFIGYFRSLQVNIIIPSLCWISNVGRWVSINFLMEFFFFVISRNPKMYSIHNTISILLKSSTSFLWATGFSFFRSRNHQHSFVFAFSEDFCNFLLPTFVLMSFFFGHTLYRFSFFCLLIFNFSFQLITHTTI